MAVCKQAENEYILHVAVANEVKRAVNLMFTLCAMHTMEDIDCQYTAMVHAQLVQMLRMQEAANAADYVHWRTAACVSLLDKPPVKLVLCGRQARMPGWHSTHEGACTAAQTAAQAHQTQPSDAAPGDPPAAPATECARELERDSTLAKLDLVQHQALHTAIEQQLGPIDSGTLHEFYTHTVAIAKTCDYCAESISGLNC
ncbi:hypothetical protein H4R19_003992 [Coemansia spiralis]|nr:hypothetical protein H4R19_003992 [Coemansia spiralis]